MFPPHRLIKKDLAVFAGLFAPGYATEKLIVIAAIPFIIMTSLRCISNLFHSMAAVRRGNSIQVDSFISLERKERERERGDVEVLMKSPDGICYTVSNLCLSQELVGLIIRKWDIQDFMSTKGSKYKDILKKHFTSLQEKLNKGKQSP